jgi:hypothetical protein
MEYTIYQIDPDGHISRPPNVITCDDDEAALNEAKRRVNGRDLEVWHRDRVVGRVPSRGG